MAHLLLELGFHRIVLDLRKQYIQPIYTKTVQFQTQCHVCRDSYIFVSFLFFEGFHRRGSVFVFRENPKPIGPQYHCDIWWYKLVLVSLITLVKSENTCLPDNFHWWWSTAKMTRVFLFVSSHKQNAAGKW